MITMGRPRPPSGGARRFITARVDDLGAVLAGFFAIVVVVAGASALALLTWPSHSGTYFSWDLGQPATAALVGGLYLASVIVFVDAGTRPRRETRVLTVGVLGLALPTLVFTARNHQVFDWSRPQAVAWVLLFCSAPISILLDLRTPTGSDRSADGPNPISGPTPITVRAVLGAISVASIGLAFGLWFEPTRNWLAEHGPIPLAGLTADYLGAWSTFVAVAAAVAVVRARPGDARSVGVLLGSVAIGAALAAARTAADLHANAARYVAGLVLLALIAAGLVGIGRPATGGQRNNNRRTTTGVQS